MFVAMRIWLHILVCWPQPAFPMYRMFVPMHYMLLKKKAEQTYLEERHDAIKDLAVSSHHNRELRIASADVASGHCELHRGGRNQPGASRENTFFFLAAS